MFKTAGLFKENPIQGNVAGILGAIPDLFGSKFDRLNPSSQITVGDTNVLFDTSYNLTQKPDWAAAATRSAIDLLDSFTDFGLRSSGGDNLKFNSSLKSPTDASTQVQRDELTGMDFAVGDSGGGPELTQSRTSSLLPSEKWAFNFKDYTIDHQGLNTLNIKVDYGLKPGITKNEYPDFVPIYKSIDNFLVNYPNETDLWEIVNKKLTEKVLDENPVLTDISIQIEDLPTDRLPYDRTSTVFRSRSGQLKEDGNFSLKDYAINHQGVNNINIDIGYQYQPEITPNEYPDFRQIYNSVDNFLTKYPNETDFWEILNKSLTQQVLAQNPALDSLQIGLEVLPTNRLPYNRASIVSLA